jgi:hypothetical protein
VGYDRTANKLLPTRNSNAQLPTLRYLEKGNFLVVYFLAKMYILLPKVD